MVRDLVPHSYNFIFKYGLHHKLMRNNHELMGIRVLIKVLSTSLFLSLFEQSLFYSLGSSSVAVNRVQLVDEKLEKLLHPFLRPND